MPSRGGQDAIYAKAYFIGALMFVIVLGGVTLRVATTVHRTDEVRPRRPSSKIAQCPRSGVAGRRGAMTTPVCDRASSGPDARRVVRGALLRLHRHGEGAHARRTRHRRAALNGKILVIHRGNHTHT